MEQKPQLTLYDLLEDCETLREERASVRVSERSHHPADTVKELPHANLDGTE
jgi:hypothetical protein